MSRSPERISSYRRHFESSGSLSFQVRVSSPSPTRGNGRYASVASSRSAGAGNARIQMTGRRTVSAARKSHFAGTSVSAGTVACVGLDGTAAMDLDAAAAENQEFLSTRTSERQEMIVLNDRLALYIDKVRSLEQQNTLLETEIEAYKNRFQKPAGLRLLYEEQLKELRKIAEQMRAQRNIACAAKESTAAQLEAMKIKYEEAVELRRKAEMDIEAFRPDVDKATSSRIALEKHLEHLEVEIEFLKRVHQQEIEELMKQIHAAHRTSQSAFALPDLAAALKQIQTQYDDIAAKNLQEMDSWYKNKFEDLTTKKTRHVDMVCSIRKGIAGAKKDIQNKERDLDALSTKNDALQAQVREKQETYKKELEALQACIEALQLELKSTKEKIALHLRKYQELLNMKMALEIEITTYRKLIEGEDLRLSGMMQSMSVFSSSSVSAIGAGMSIGMGGRGVGASGEKGGGMAGSMAGGGGVRVMASGVACGGGFAGTVGAGLDSNAGGMGGRMGPAGSGKERGTVGMADVADLGGTGEMGGGVHGAGHGGIGGVLGSSAAGARAASGDRGGVGKVSVGVGTSDSAGIGKAGSAGLGGIAAGSRSGSSGEGKCVGGTGVGLVRDVGSAGTVNSGVGAGVGGSKSTGYGGANTRASGGMEGSGGIDGGMRGGGRLVVDFRDGAGSGPAGVAADGGRGGIAGGMRYGPHGYDATIKTYAGQAVELTERRTVLIRTVKNEDDVLETDHQEQTYTISGAADDSEDDQA